jgi:hypothetical protein
MKKVSISLMFTTMAFVGFTQTRLSKSDMVVLDNKALVVTKEKIVNKDKDMMLAYESLIKQCDKSLNFGPFSVMDKKDFPPSGNKHDYMSLAPYWWPDPSSKNGLPYIRKDGEVNPEVGNYPDKQNMPRVCEKVYEFSLAFYLSGNETYAKKARALVHTWFLDTATKMNPNVNYGQAVKGVVEGRGEGLIDTRHFIFLLDGVQLLNKSKSWSTNDNNELKIWFKAYYDWLDNSKIGKDEKKASNNHGVWYDAQALAITNFLENNEESKKIINRALGRLNDEMDAKGAFPKELERTNSLHYSVFILNAFECIAQLADNINVDFRSTKLSNGMSFKNAYDFLLPYLVEEKTWTWPTLNHFDIADAYPLLLSASKHLQCVTCVPYMNKKSPDYSKMIIKLL